MMGTKGGRAMSGVNWSKIRNEYITTNISQRVIAEKYSISYSTVKRRAVKEDWRSLRAEKYAKSASKAVEITTTKEAERAARIGAVSDKLMAVLERAVDCYNAVSPEQLTAEDKRQLRALAGAIKDIKDIQDIRDRSTVREQNARIKLLEKQAESDEDKQQGVTIEIKNVGGYDE
jgi:hypothetical protein